MKKEFSKADLDAANREVESLMIENKDLKRQADEAYSNGYRDGTAQSASFAGIVKEQANLLCYYTAMISGSIITRKK